VHALQEHVKVQKLEWPRHKAVPTIMTKHVPALLLTFGILLAGCSQLPPKDLYADGKAVPYVDATTLTSSDEYSGVGVLTVVPLQYIAAADAEARLQADLPEGVRVSHVAQKVLVQGPGHSVAEVLETLRKIDVH
tara:strand:+ start:47405 stop:47809 length:405 start_codon:yes stop_codon:yes gene_type:complete